MEGDPGSMSAYSLAIRDMFKGSDGPGPQDYDVHVGSILKRCETVAPFDTTAVRKPPLLDLNIPGPKYFPVKRDLRQSGSPLFRWGERFKEKIDFSCSGGEIDADGDLFGRLHDPWVRMTEKIAWTATTRPRVSYEKYVSNNVPTVFHPSNVRCFIEGIDGRIYPWKMNRNNMAGPADYNTYKVYTSQSVIPKDINFAGMAERKSLFPPTVGAGPAGYCVRTAQQKDGGQFLSKKSDDPKSSSLRMFDIIQRQTIRETLAGPDSTTIPSEFDKCSSKCVLAPFKSKTKLGFIKPSEGPGPADHFKKQCKQGKMYPPEKAPFDTSEERFLDPELYEMENRPSPSDYDIQGFADKMQDELVKHEAAITNPKLGFLSSAEARPAHKGKGEINIVSQSSCHCLCEKPRKWKNLRPRTGLTYGYNGRPPKYPDSPGPIYDTAPGSAAVKSRKSWWDPRHPTRTGFLNSGCKRDTEFFNIDKNVPGAGKYYSKLPICCRHPGRRSAPGPRFLEKKSETPGPVYKLHEKVDSSMWRASHLGTHNAYLKHVGILFPWAGGFRKKNLSQAGDQVWHINREREDEYAQALCPTSLDNAKEGFRMATQQGLGQCT